MDLTAVTSGGRTGRGLRAGLPVLAATVLVFATLALAQVSQSRRDLVRPEQAQRMEALLARAFPGAALDWDRDQLVYSDGRRAVAAWLQEHAVRKLAMEATAQYWKPVWVALEGRFMNFGMGLGHYAAT